MSRDYRLYCRDIITEARFIEARIQGLDFETFIADENQIKAVLFSLTVIGEAAHHIPAELQARLPDVPWEAITATRNTIVHGYFALNQTIIWDIVTREVTPLRQQVETLLDTLDEESA